MRLSVDEVMNILFLHDPMNIHSPRTDEYEPEAKALAPELRGDDTEDDVLDKLYSVLDVFFNTASDEDGNTVRLRDMVGDKEKYRHIANNLHMMMKIMQKASKSNANLN